MSSNKEQEILDKQRQLAARLILHHQSTKAKPAPPPPSQPSASCKKLPPNHQQSAQRARARSTSVILSSAVTGKTAAAVGTSNATNSNSRSSSSSNNSVKRRHVVDLTGTAEASALAVAAASMSSKPKMKRPSTTSSRPKPPPPPASASAPHPSSTLMKRASKKRPPVLSTAALVAAARAKASTSSTATSTLATTHTTFSAGSSSTGVKASATKDNNDIPKSSPQLKRKTLKAGSALLANLVQNVNQDAKSIGSISDSSLPTVKPDDFWKHLREWDFVGQYYQSTVVASQQQQQKQDDEVVVKAKKPLPDVFLSTRHYAAAWAPLCLAECRAQIAQEVVAKSNSLSPNMVLVKVKTTSSKVRHHHHRNGPGAGPAMYDHDQPWLQGNETGVYVQLQTTVPHHDREWTFSTNELVLLLVPQYKDIFRDMNRACASSRSNNNNSFRTVVPGKQLGDYGSIALVGHVEQARGGLNGLVVKVSARKWASVGLNQMYLLSLGNNVTALREFTALCSIEQLPLKSFLLGQHLQQHQGEKTGNGSKPRKLSRHTSVEQLLAQMGGPQALGQGFVAYAQRKFNASQLTAIAASANEYGDGGFTLIKGPPGTGKTTTLVAVLNSLHIRQYNKYYQEVRRLAALPTGTRQGALENARKAKPRLLVCAPSNAAVDNIILKIIEDGFVDGQGQRYNPLMVRVGIGQSAAVKDVSLENMVDSILSDNMDPGRLDASICGYKVELSRITQDIAKLRRRSAAIASACPWPLSKDWEIRIDEESFDETGRVYFVNHKEQVTSYEVPPPPEPDEGQFQTTSMPEYRSYMSRIVKLVESYFKVKTHLERCTIIKGASDNGSNRFEIRRSLETHLLDSVHIVLTTLGTSGNRTMESISKFEVVVVDEAAQSVEPATLSALHLGSRHCVLVGDPQQLPATIFNVSGRNSKYDRSLFQRLEEGGQPVYMLNEQYRMHPKISHFPRHIFYGGTLLDGPNVRQEGYGNPMRAIVSRAIPSFHPFTILDLDSKEERGGTSLSNYAEASLAVYLYQQLVQASKGLASASRVAVITPYAQQSKLLHQSFSDALGPRYTDKVEVNTVDAFQGREANVVIFSAVRAAGSSGIGFLSDVRRMNVALTRAKHFLFVIARCESVVVNPYWNDLVQHARETNAVVRVPMTSGPGRMLDFGSPTSWVVESAKLSDPRKRKRLENGA